VGDRNGDGVPDLATMSEIENRSLAFKVVVQIARLLAPLL
jgi:hypothetical protein